MPRYGLWFYLLVGCLVTALMHASAATIAIVLAALNSGLITFDIGAVMVIGANIGTTITVSHKHANNFDRALDLRAHLNPTPQIDKSKPDAG